MTIKRITNTSLEANRVILRPRVTYTMSGSDTTGSIPLIPNPSPNIRVTQPYSRQNFYNGQENNFDEIINDIIQFTPNQNDGSLFQNSAHLITSFYLTASNLAPLPAKNDKEFNISIENVPGLQYYESSTNLPVTGSKGALPTLVNSILEKEIESNRNLDYSFTNYNCIGFVSGGNESAKTALMYQDESSTTEFKSFAVSFFVKPPAVTPESGHFNPGTIFCIDDLISVSLISGSDEDRFGNPSSFNIVSHFSRSMNNPLSSFDYAESAYDGAQNKSSHLNFQQDVICTFDNPIKRDSWHRVSIIVEGTNENRSHSIYIDGNKATGSIITTDFGKFNRSYENQDGNSNSQIVIGNKIQGNVDYNEFFIEKYEDFEKYTSNGNKNEPAANFEAPFFGEAHEIVFATSRLERFPESNFLSNQLSTLSTSSLDQDINVDFYLPVLFSSVEDQKIRTGTKLLNEGSISLPDSPLEVTKSTHENFVLSNDLRFPEVNITSFLCGYTFQNGAAPIATYPRCLGMETLSDLSTNSNYDASAQDLQEVASSITNIFTRNNLIRPCDNSYFNHNYREYESILDSMGGSSQEIKRRKHLMSSSFRNKDMTSVSLKGHYDFGDFSASPYFSRFNPQDSSFCLQPMYADDRLSDSAIDPLFDKNIYNKRASSPWSTLLLAETGFYHSNLVTIIDIPQMFYSKKIHPGTFEIVDHDIDGSNGMLTYKIKDNGLGALYRDDTNKSSTYNKCGIILYELGIAILTHPALCMFGRNHFTVKFRGEKDLNVLNVNAHIGKYEFNESVNSSYNSIGKIGSDSNDNEIVMITGIEYLDENLNVVMRSNLSQPVSKREFDEILFRSRIDF